MSKKGPLIVIIHGKEKGSPFDVGFMPGSENTDLSVDMKKARKLNKLLKSLADKSILLKNLEFEDYSIVRFSIDPDSDPGIHTLSTLVSENSIVLIPDGLESQILSFLELSPVFSSLKLVKTKWRNSKFISLELMHS